MQKYIYREYKQVNNSISVKTLMSDYDIWMNNNHRMWLQKWL